MSNTKNVRHPIFETVRSIAFEVVVKNFRKYAKYKTDRKVSSTLGLYCKNVLLNQVVEVNSRIDLTSNKLARVYGINNVFIHDLNTKNNSPSGTVSESSKIRVLSVHSEEFSKLSLETENIPELGGLQEEFEKVKRLYDINRSSTKFYQPRGVLLHGPPGCGKTSFGRHLAKKCGAVFYNVESSNLLTSEHGSGAASLKNIIEKARSLLEEGPVVLFLDEIDMLCPRPETSSLGNKQLSSALMTEMDALHGDKVAGLLILAATNSISSVHPHLRRPGRFDQEILINIPSQTQRQSILQILTSDWCLASDVSCKTLAQMTPGYVGADLRSLCEEAFNHAQDQHSSDISMGDFHYALHKTVPSLKKGTECVVDLKPVHWDEIGSLEDIKMEIRQSLEWPLKYPEILQSMDIPPTKGILLYGPPGCCKTTLVRAAATSCNVSFLSLSGAQVYSAYVGESERLISQAFQKARALAPSILFFDEIESLVGKRSLTVGNNRVQERILSTMLNEMDGVGNKLDLNLSRSTSQREQRSDNKMTETVTVKHEESSKAVTDYPDEHLKDSSNTLKVIVVGATNRPDMLDSAILRPGRLDKHIYVPPPDAQARQAILKVCSSKMPCQDIDFESIADRTELYSGADLKNLCKEACLQTLREHTGSIDDQTKITVTNHHFQKALDTVKASLTSDMLKSGK